MQIDTRQQARPSRLIDKPIMLACDLWPECCCEEDCEQERWKIARYSRLTSGPAVTCLIVAITSVAIGIAVLASIWMR